MVGHAAAALDPARATVRVADLADFELPAPVDAVFSNAVFHWVPDHDALFARLFAALKPGGRLVAQCGGHGNIARFRQAADAVGGRAPYAAHLAGFTGVWNYQTAEATTQRLADAGFADIETWLQPWETTPDEPEAFVRTICLNPQLDHLPAELHDAFVADVLAEAGDPLVLDYVRLNIDARRAPHLRARAAS
jgi:trans-aconitate 2-methyltransferase